MFNYNQIGIEQTLSTLTGISKKIAYQKFYDLRGYTIKDFIEVISNQFPYSNHFFKRFGKDLAGNFEDGIISNVAEFGRVPSVSVAYKSKTYPRFYWQTDVTYTRFEILQAQAEARMYDESAIGSLLDDKIKARKRKFDLGKIKYLFLGSKPLGLTGLLTNDEVQKHINTIYNKPISQMTQPEFENFRLSLAQYYLENCEYTANGTTLLMSTKEKVALNGVTDNATPNKTRYDLLLESMKKTFGEGFKIVDTPYCDKRFNNLGYDIMVIYNNDRDSLLYDDALSFNPYNFITSDGGNTFIGSCIAGIGCVQVYYPKEMMYLINTNV